MRTVGVSVVQTTIVETRLGPIGIAESSLGLEAVRVAYEDADQLRDALQELFPQAEEAEHSLVGDLFDAYARGRVVNFEDIPINDRQLTPFRRMVTAEARKVPYGQTSTYSELAERAGSPNAYRAVGSTMASNRWAILVPCHRILAKGGALGGYSAPQGLTFKQRLLELERGSRS